MNLYSEEEMENIRNAYRESIKIMDDTSCAGFLEYQGNNLYEMSREELIAELSNLQLDYQDRIDDIENLEDRLEERNLDILELKSTVAWFRYEMALRNSID